MRQRISRSGVCTVFALLLGLAACGKEPAPPPPPPPEVKAATVIERDVPIYLEAIGETRGNTEIEIRARVEGFVESVDFEEGTLVQKGQLLYTLDPRPFEAAVARSRANLAEADADLARARQDVARYEPLVAKNAISRQEYETAVAVERAQASAVEAARASAQSAELDLSYTRVLAPETGLVGKTEVYPGTLVGRGQSTLLTRISKVDPINARFTLPERDYLTYAKRNEERTSRAGVNLPIELVLADGSVHPHTGRFVFVDRAVDPRTGTILLEASFPNPGGIVRPGQYARVRAAVDLKRSAILVPQRAVQEMQGTYSVAVVGADNTIEIRMVQTGERVGSLWVIDSGLEAGERIVVEGLQKVRPGITVNAETVSITDGEGPAAPGSAANAAGGAAPAAGN
jgi:membrane fusion protein (multidrug efflux system)